MDADVLTERLLQVEAEALTVASEARRLRRSLVHRRMFDASEVAAEVVAFALMARHRSDDVAVIRLCVEPAMPPTVAAAPAPWWVRLWRRVTSRTGRTP